MRSFTEKHFAYTFEVNWLLLDWLQQYPWTNKHSKLILSTILGFQRAISTYSTIHKFGNRRGSPVFFGQIHGTFLFDLVVENMANLKKIRNLSSKGQPLPWSFFTFLFMGILCLIRCPKILEISPLPNRE